MLKKPSLKSYEVSTDGISIDNQFYSYDEFRSFSILEEGAVNSIWLKGFKGFHLRLLYIFLKTRKTEFKIF